MGVMVSHSGFDCISLVISGRRKWQPTPIFLPGESQGQGSLVGSCLWDRRVGHNCSNLAAAASSGLVKHYLFFESFPRTLFLIKANVD